MRTLTNREAEVLALLGEHLTHAEIAARLVISIRTVETHVAALRRKLDIPAHRELVRYAAAQRSTAARRGVQLGPCPPLTSFVGRERERAELTNAVHRSRVVSVTGAGGAGKTRLARAVSEVLADTFADYVWHVDLVPVTDAAALPHAIAVACGTADLPGRDIQAALIRGLSGQRALLVLDNCEHLVNAVAVLVERLVSVCPELHVLITSRARLVLPFEYVYPLSGLSQDGDALALFLERARSAGWDGPRAAQLPRIDGICRALDGLPLAIELAAVRSPSLGLLGVERGLSDHRQLLTGGPRVSPRHRSMHDTLDWSYRLLDPLDRAVLCRLSVFPSGFDAAGAGAVAGYGTVEAGQVPSALARLVDHSLLTAVAGRPDGRWRMLEPVRQFSSSQVSSTDKAANPAHLAWVGRRVGSLLSASLAPGRGWHDEFDDVAEDVRTALDWASRQPDGQSAGRKLASALAALLFRSGRAREAQGRYEQAAALAASPMGAVEYLIQAAAVAKCRVQGEEALRLELAAIRAARADGAITTLARVLVLAAETILRFEGMFAGNPPTSTALSLLEELKELTSDDPLLHTAAAVIQASRSDPTDPRCRRQAENATRTAHRLGDPIRESAALDVLTGTYIVGGRPLDAPRYARRRVDLLLGRAVEPAAALELKDALHMAVLSCVGAGDLPSATKYGEQHRTLAFLREQRDLAVEPTLVPDALAGRWNAAAMAGELFLDDWVAAGRRPAPGRAIGPCAVAMAYGLLGRDRERERWLDVVAPIRGVERDAATVATGYGELFEAILRLDQDRPDDALTLLATETRGQSGWYGPLLSQWRAALLAEAAVLAADPGAVRLWAEAERGCVGNPIAAALAERARAIVEGDEEALINLAQRLGEAGAPYQQARTLLLTRGPESREGEILLGELREAQHLQTDLRR